MSANYGPATENDRRMRTADGRAIKDGGRYFNYYDCEWVFVDFCESEESDHRNPSHKYWDGWFTVRADNGDDMPGSRYILNGERMSAVEPEWYRNSKKGH